VLICFFQRIPAAIDILNELWAVPDGRQYEMNIVESTPSSFKSATPEYVNDVVALFKRLREEFYAKVEELDSESTDQSAPKGIVHRSSRCLLSPLALPRCNNLIAMFRLQIRRRWRVFSEFHFPRTPLSTTRHMSTRC
jgi:hypothetical protein